MIGISTSTLLSAPVGSAWKTPGMGGYIGIAARYSEAGTISGVSVAAGDTLVVVQQLDADGSGSSVAPGTTLPYTFLLKKATGTFIGGGQATVGAASLLSNGGTENTGLTSSRTTGPALSAELLDHLLGSDTWTSSTIGVLEGARIASDHVW